ncbi:MAG TPA: hypothetical protein PLX96_07380 [Candidatus Omnitrophota bacterium]|jgi:Tfp pilus assembly protein PilX|nr:hypothetical protein [Candidatus Omnitrophota bacterium]
MRNLKLKETRGAALVTVVVVIVVVTMLVAAGLNFVTGMTSLNTEALDGVRALYLAEAGLQRALHEIRNEDNPATEDEPLEWDFSGDIIQIDIVADDTDPSLYDVTSTVSLGRAERASTATIRKQGGEAVMTGWGL